MRTLRSRTVPVRVNDLLSSADGSTLYASYVAAFQQTPQYSDGLLEIDPATGTVTRHLPLDGHPGVLARSDDGSTLYTMVAAYRDDGRIESHSVTRVDLAAWEVTSSFALGRSFLDLPNNASTLAVLPGETEAVAVARTDGYTAADIGVAIYDSGVMRSDTVATASALIAFGDVPGRLYGFNNRTTAFTFRRFAVDADGVRELSADDRLVTQFGVRNMTVSDGLVYLSDGNVIDGEGRYLAGSFTAPGQGYSLRGVATEPELGRVLGLGVSASRRRLVAYVDSTFASIALDPVVNGEPLTPLVRWGELGVAFATQGAIVIAETGLLAGELPVARADSDVEFGEIEGRTTRSFDISNPGNALVQVTGITTDIPGLTLLGGPLEVEPGATTAAEVEIDPTQTGSFSGTISLESNGYGDPSTIGVTGVMTEPVLEVDREVSFGTVPAARERSLTLTVRNPSQRVVAVSSITEPGFPLEVVSSPSEIPAQSSAQIQLSFTPQEVGPYEATLVITSDAYGSPDTVSVTATVVAPQELCAGLMGDSAAACVAARYRPATVLSLEQSEDRLYDAIDATRVAGTLGVNGIYTGHFVPFDASPSTDPSEDVYNGDPSDGIRLDYAWPRSEGVEGSMAERDMHHLFPARGAVSSARGAAPFAPIEDTAPSMWYRASEQRETVPTIPDEWSQLSEGSFEPRVGARGDVARAVFYVAATYGDQVNLAWFSSQIGDLLEWHASEPATAADIARADRIAQFQTGCGSGLCTNPFVQDPSLAGRAFGSGEVSSEPPPRLDQLSVAAYPNPARGLVTIAVGGGVGPIQVSLWDVLGREVAVARGAPSDRVSFDTSALAPGVYTVRATDRFGEVTAQLSVIR